MILPDVNVLVYAFREDAPDHAAYHHWLQQLIATDEPFAVSDHVLGGFLRVVTHPRVFRPPAPIKLALAFAEAVRNRPTAVRIAPGERHWTTFRRLCRSAGVRGNLVPDAWLAALAIEHGCEFATTDRDFARFSGLRWLHPLQPR